MTELRDKPHPSQCTATQTAALHHHHTTPSSCSDRNRPQASDSRQPWSITQNGSISSLVFQLFSGFFFLPSFRPPFVVSLLFRHFLNSHPISSLPSRPRPQTALRSRPTDCLLWPTSPDGTRSSLLSSYPPRQSRSLAAVGRSCCWRVSFLFRAHRGGVESGQSLSERVCQQKAAMLSRILPERISKKEKTARRTVIRELLIFS